MGIDNVEILKNIAQDDDDGNHHVVVIGRTGKHEQSMVYLLGPGTKKDAIQKSIVTYRENKRLASNISLVSTVVYSGTEENATEFYNKLDDKIKEGESL